VSALTDKLGEVIILYNKMSFVYFLNDEPNFVTLQLKYKPYSGKYLDFPQR
jgi:hypothetical protein